MDPSFAGTSSKVQELQFLRFAATREIAWDQYSCWDISKPLVVSQTSVDSASLTSLAAPQPKRKDDEVTSNTPKHLRRTSLGHDKDVPSSLPSIIPDSQSIEPDDEPNLCPVARVGKSNELILQSGVNEPQHSDEQNGLRDRAQSVGESREGVDGSSNSYRGEEASESEEPVTSRRGRQRPQNFDDEDTNPDSEDYHGTELEPHSAHLLDPASLTATHEPSVIALPSNTFRTLKNSATITLQA
ncbi:uncharacterized protein PAC_00519 [Phialocephala subalpina]|uniref:Uncharacterized protein n=1 Tax=Phialocephala subalpina TaxID=576137 RepID=A0A1L7WCY1_9HELO|nr:uncharacterized protein PAC_00519 [Phialocephala subalpina]